MGVPDTRTRKRRPGNFDALKMQERFPGDSRYGFPHIVGVEECRPESLCAWTQRNTLTEEELATGAWHFYTDDYRFEPVWNKPDKYLSYLDKTHCVLTPDFSIYLEWPRAAQVWNVYRNRWLGAKWESEGYQVIPTITWGDWRTYDFCFAGVQRGATVSISTLGVSSEDNEKDLFTSGYYAMAEEIQPSLVLVYGEQWEKLGLSDVAPVFRYSPKGILEMRQRLESESVDSRQLPLFDMVEGG